MANRCTSQRDYRVGVDPTMSAGIHPGPDYSAHPWSIRKQFGVGKLILLQEVEAARSAFGKVRVDNPPEPRASGTRWGKYSVAVDLRLHFGWRGHPRWRVVWSRARYSTPSGGQQRQWRSSLKPGFEQRRAYDKLATSTGALAPRLADGRRSAACGRRRAQSIRPGWCST